MTGSADADGPADAGGPAVIKICGSDACAGEGGVAAVADGPAVITISGSTVFAETADGCGAVGPASATIFIKSSPS